MEKAQVSNDRKRNWEQLNEKVPKKHVLQAKQCQMMGTAIKVDGKKQNTTGCKMFTQVCHNEWLFQWNKKVYCIQCYKTVVTDEYDTTTTFEEIFERRKVGWPKRKHADEATPVPDTIEQYVVQYLNSAGFEMPSREFYEWKKSINNQNI